ncbi:DUF1963 domain-containing protein [Labrenzia sp. DG1229]|uniref:DUF1963 domain-containing protein n=1 Tax=Labrenzia sp. DG1229 TaxID=681847 RepID=UPI00155DAAB2|nr:DUF1963 domain-containing protein [Labrenzia sp. DG1229]
MLETAGQRGGGRARRAVHQPSERIRWTGPEPTIHERVHGQSDKIAVDFAPEPAAPIEVQETVSVVLRRQVPIRADESPRSWFGGSPMMPENVPWPRSLSRDHPQRGEFPLHFLAQLRCSDFPEDLWSGLGPREGWLLFFVDPNSSGPEGDGQGYRVLHTQALGVERALPQDLGTVHDGTFSGPNYGYLEETDEIPKTWRRWPVDFVTVPNRLFEDENGVERVTPDHFAGTLYAGQEVSDAERPPVPDPFTERMALAVLTSIRTRLGKHPLKPEWNDEVIEGLMNPDAFASLKKDIPALKQTLEELRNSLQDDGDPGDEETEAKGERIQKLEVELRCQSRLAAVLDRYPSADSLKDYRDAVVRANHAWRMEALRDLENIIDQVSSSDRNRVLTKDEWPEIQKYLKQTRTSYFRFHRNGNGDFFAFEREISLWDFYNKNYVQLWEFVADYYVDPERRDSIPTTVSNAFEPYWRKLYDNRPHRVGGEIDALQSNPSAGPTDSLLLLHLASDNAMNWVWGDAGIVYFRISPQDLATGRYENAGAMLECF